MKPTGHLSTVVRIIEVIDKPLGFYVLALLIIESFLGLVLVGAKNLQGEQLYNGMWMGVGMFILVIAVVTIIVLWKPQNLTFDKNAHLIDRGKATFGTDKKPVKNRDDQFPTIAKNGGDQ
jgi:hypothetical protein